MKIVHHHPETNSLLSSIKGDKEQPANLPNADKDLLFQMAEAFTIINGGQFKKRRQSA